MSAGFASTATSTDRSDPTSKPHSVRHCRGYVFAEGISPDPVSVAKSTLAVASDITTTESARDVTVVADFEGSASALSGLAEEIPNLTFTIVDGRIEAIGARLASGGEDSFGFVWDYDPDANVPAIAVPAAATAVVDIAGTIGTGDPGDIDCTLGS